MYEYAGFKILSDPWLSDGAFEGSWCHSPKLMSKAEDFFDVDLIYVSHLHPDHYDEETLKKFPKTIPILILDKAPNYLRRKIEALQFQTLHVIPDQGIFFAGPFKITMYGPFTGYLFHETQIGNLIDSGIVLEAGGITILNANDNAPTREASQKLYEAHGAFDLVQLVDSCAGPYPACFTNLTHEEKLSERDRILKRHLDLMLDCAKILKAKRMMPFAGHYKLQGRLAKLNQYLAVFEPEEVCRWIENAGIKSLLLKERESFEFEVKYSYDNYEIPTDEELRDSLYLAMLQLREKQKKLNCYPEWEVFINYIGEFGDYEFEMALTKNSIIGSIIFNIDTKLLWAIINRKIHWNNAEVGCHIQIYRTPNIYEPDIHMLMCYFHI